MSQQRQNYQTKNQTGSHSEGRLITYVEFATQYSLLVCQKIRLPNVLFKLMIFLRYGYLARFVFEQQKVTLMYNIQVFELIDLITSLSKDYYYLMSPSVQFVRYSYVIVIAQFLLYIGNQRLQYTLYRQKLKKNKSFTLKDYLNTMSSSKLIFQIGFAFYQEIVRGLLYLKFYEFSIQSFVKSIADIAVDGRYSPNMILSGFISLVWILYTLLRLHVTGESMDIFVQRHLTINLSILDYLVIILQLTIITINQIEIKHSILLYGSVILFVSSMLLSVLNIFKNLGYTEYQFVKFELAVICVTTVYCLSAFYFQITYGSIMVELPVIILLVSFALASVLIGFLKKKLLNIQLDYNKVFYPKIIQYQISIFHQNSNKNQAERLVIYYSYYTFHKYYCNQSKCYCRINPNETDLFNTIEADFMKLFNQGLSQSNENKNINSYLLHFISSLNSVGFTNQALQQINLSIQLQQPIQQIVQLNNENAQDNDVKTMRNVQSISQRSATGSMETQNQEITYQRFELIKNKHKFNSFQMSRIQILMEQIKSQMNANFLQNTLKSSDQTQELAHSVKLFIQAENSNNSIKSEVIKAFERKITFLQMISRSVGVSSGLLFSQSKQTSMKFQKLEKKLMKLYELFPSQKIQSVNAFFQAEVMNNFFIAHKIANITTIADEKLLKLHQNLAFNLFQNDVNYVMISYEQNQEMKILQKSNQIHQFFGYEFEKFREINNLLALIPSGIKKAHPQLVQNYLINGQSKFFRQVSTNLASFANEYIFPVDFFFDINFTDMNDMNFIAFLMNQTNNNSYIIINGNLYITSISQNLYPMLGIKINYQSSRRLSVSSQEPTYVKDIPINLVIPDFKQVCAKLLSGGGEKRDSYYRRFYNQELYFIKQDVLNNIQKEEFRLFDVSSRLKSVWKNPINLTKYIGNYSVYYRDLEGPQSYYIIEFQEIKLVRETFRLLTKMFDRNMTEVDATQPARSFNPMITHSSQMDLLDHLDDLYDVESEEKVNKPRQLQPDIKDNTITDKFRQTFGQSNLEEEFIKLKLSSVLLHQESNTDKMLFQQNTSQDNGIMLETYPILHTLQDSHMQQKFFFENKEQDDSVECSSMRQNQQQFIENNANQEIREYVMNQLQVEPEQKIVAADDAASQVSSLAGFRKSKYFRKYETIDKILKSQRLPIHFKMIFVMQILRYLLTIIVTAIVFTNVRSDLSRFLQEIEMLQIKVNILGPVEKFIISEYAWVSYFIEGYITQKLTIPEMKNLSQFSIYSIYQTYGDLKRDFSTQLTNPYLEEFFTNQMIEVRERRITDYEYRNMSLRESLIKWVAFLYDFTALIDWKGFNLANLNPNQPFLSYTNVNMVVFMKRFNLLVEQILAYTRQRTQAVSSKWTATLVPFMVIFFCISLITFRFYLLFMKNYESILHAFRMIDSQSLQKDLIRFNIIQEILEKDANLMFKYKFDLEQKEKYLSSEDIKRQQTLLQRRSVRRENVNYNISIRQPWFKSALVIGSSYLLFLIYSGVILILTQTYLTQYLTTTIFYKDMADVGVQVCEIYGNREILYYFSSYPYYSAQDKEYFYQSLENGLNEIRRFSASLSEFPTLSNNYLVSDEFRQSIIYYSTNDICKALPESYYQIAAYFCNKSYDGVAQKGIIPTLNTIYNAIQQESLVNNFTYRNIQNYPSEVFELPLITSQVFLLLMVEFKSSLQQITYELITTINIICTVYLILATFQIVFTLKYIRQYYQDEFQLVKRFLLLLPQQTIFLESHFERAVNLLMVQDKLI